VVETCGSCVILLIVAHQLTNKKLTIVTFAIVLIFRSLKKQSQILIGVLPAIKLTKDF
jgi:hypothetical protein